MKAIYLGAGIDIRPIKYCPDITHFYYIDGQPYSEFGVLQSTYINRDGTNGYSRPLFLQRLDHSMDGIGMKLVSIDGNIRTYNNGIQTVSYLTNTANPTHYNNYKSIVNDFDVVIVAGHNPNSKFMDATSKKCKFIGFEGTVYHPDAHEGSSSLITRLHKKELECSEYTYITRDGIKFNFLRWNLFYDYYKSTR